MALYYRANSRLLILDRHKNAAGMSHVNHRDRHVTVRLDAIGVQVRNGGSDFSFDLAGRLVFPQALERWMA